MTIHRGTQLGAILCCAVVLAVTGCAGKKKPDGPKKRTVLMTEYDDARLGAESSQAVAAQMGVMDDPALTAYISEIGFKLLRGVPRRSFDYQFHVVDQVEPNAFALPGGYIFISRGLLALANNEDELACVIGHEITHAAHRHSAAQQGIQARANPLSMPWNKASRMASYGRDMERDADEGGQILCAAAGYDPMGMSTFLKNLGHIERMRIGYARRPSFYDTHPGSRERAAVNAVRAKEIRWRRDPEIGDPRKSLLEHVDGLEVGQRPEAGMFYGDRFLHPDLDFHLKFPSGWLKSNTAQAVGAGSPQGDAVVFLTADVPPGNAQKVAEDWIAKTKEEQKIKIEESKPVKIGSIEAWRIKVAGNSGRSSVISYVTFIPYGGMTWRITGASRSSKASTYLGRTLSTSRSFRPLTDAEREMIHATRLRVATARAGEDLASLIKRTGSVWDVGETAIQNGIFIDHLFEGGEFVKIALLEPYRPKKPEAAVSDPS